MQHFRKYLFPVITITIELFPASYLSAKIPPMKQEKSISPDKTRGRKRDESRTESIIQAAIELLLEVGYDKFRIQDVADRAGSGTGAIYRRWPRKEILVAEAIRNMPVTVAKVTDDPVADLRELVKSKCFSAFDKPDLVPGLISAMRSDSKIEEAVKEGYSLEYLRSTIARIIGDDHPHLNLLTELTPAIAHLRTSFSPETIDPEVMTDEIISLIQSVANQKHP